MTIISRILGAFAKLPPAVTYDIIVERDLPISMPDGTILLANHYVPRNNANLPTILIRSPYGRSGPFGLLNAQLFAERGYQVLIQSVRGTFGSGGTFDPFIHEHNDGLATVAWIKQQPWFTGELLTHGASYLGFVQWAIARDAAPELKAMAIQVSTADFRDQTYAGGAYSLDTIFSWANLIANQETSGGLLKQLFMRGQRRSLFSHLPLRDLDALATGKHMPFFQEWLEHTEPGDEYWKKRDLRADLKDIAAPITMVGGWYDIFLPSMLHDYQDLRAAGKQIYLTIGPWAHSSIELAFYAIRDALTWFKAQLSGDYSHIRQAPVHLFLTGANIWRDFQDWPVSNTQAQRWYLQPQASLAPTIPISSEPDSYRYDPANPTPALAGPVLTGKATPVDNRTLEMRSDVLIYTGNSLDQDIDVIGPVSVELFVRSSLQYTDFFARLCDVDEKGVSLNVCDALIRLQPGQPFVQDDGTLRVIIELWPTAHRFRRGHKIRLQVSSGAHPRYARNTGSGEPLTIATKLVAADQLVYHDPEHPSSIVLSVLP